MSRDDAIFVVQHIDGGWSVMWENIEYEPDQSGQGKYDQYVQALEAAHEMDERRHTEYGVRVVRLPKIGA